MGTFDRYLFRETVKPLALALLVLLLALGLERLLRLVRTVSDHGASVGDAIEILVYLIPHYLGLALPAALFLAVMLVYRRMLARGELTAMLTSGVSLFRLMRPAVLMSVALVVVMLVNNGFAQPHARYSYRAKLHEVSGTIANLQLRPGVFHQIDDGLVLRADEVSRDGRVWRHVFVSDVDSNGRRTMLTAGEARVENAADGTALVLRLYDGNLLRLRRVGPPKVVAFGEYLWRPSADIVEPRGPRGRDERELTYAELASPDAGGLAPKATAAEKDAELHTRLVQAFSLLVLAVLAVPMALLGGNRTQRGYGLALGLATLVLYEKLVGLAEALASQAAAPAWLVLWLPPLLLTGATWALVVHASEAAGAPLGAWYWRRVHRRWTFPGLAPSPSKP